MYFQTCVREDINFEAIEDRLRLFDAKAAASSFAKKRSSLQQRFSHFLSLLAHKPSIVSACPDDVRKFLVWCDKSGKTPVHSVTCPFLGLSGRQTCQCPMRLAARTVHFMVQQLSDIFQVHGRGKEWDVFMLSGNPAYSPVVKQYVKFVKEEQAQAHVVPKQAKPIFLSKIKQIGSFINRQLSRSDLSLRERFVLARDQALFKVQFFAGDRASDVCNILTQEVKLLPDGAGHVYHHTYGKTLRGDGKSNTFVIKRCSDGLLCPVLALEIYQAKAREWGVNLTRGFLFRPVSEAGVVLEDKLSYSAVYERLRNYLVSLGIYEGETPHSLRAGCAITLAISGAAKNNNEIMQHVGWSSENSANYYSRAQILKDAGTVAGNLAATVDDNATIELFFQKYGDFSCLEQAFH